MHAAFRNQFAVKMGHFFLKPDILHKHGATRARGQAMVIVGYRRAGVVGK